MSTEDLKDNHERSVRLSAELGAWQPMDTAPMDGKIFLAFARKGDKTGMAVIYWNSHQEKFCDPVSCLPLYYFEHWMPLPEAPT